jgi:excisionase family DNA binding protein
MPRENQKSSPRNLPCGVTAGRRKSGRAVNAPLSAGGVVLLTPEQLERLLERAAEQGAHMALEAVKASPAPALVPAAAMCARLGISRSSLHRLRADHGCPCVRVGDTFRYSPTEVEAWLRARGGSS